MTPSETWGDHLDPEAGWPAEPLTGGQQQVVDAVRARLRDEAVWSEPPAALRATLLARAAAEQQDPGAVRHPHRQSPRAPRRRTRRLVALAVAAAIALVAGAVTLWPRQDLPEFTVAGTALAPQASARVTLEEKSAGVAIRMRITGLKPAPPGAYYAAWLQGPAGVVPVGTFHWRKGGIPIDLWSGVTADRYPELFVTLQREGAPPGPSDQVVLRGRTG